MKIVIAGAKGTGKSSLGRELSAITGLEAIEIDRLIEKLHELKDGHFLTCREIFAEHGEEFFRDLEKEVTLDVAARDWQMIITGGSIMLDPENRRRLRENAIIVLLTAKFDVVWQRSVQDGTPPWLAGPDGKERFEQDVRNRQEVIRPFADVIVDTTDITPKELAQRVIDLIVQEMAVRSRAANTYGDIIRVTTFGESHGPAIGAVLDGVRPGLELSPADIQGELNRRRPGQSAVTTPRDEKDRVEILSGVFEGKTTGAPIAMIIFNRDQDSSKYEAIKGIFRPGHADFTYYKKYGIQDYRGGARSSGRETAGRVMCGAIAKKILGLRGVSFVAHAVEVAGIKARTCDYDVIETNPVRCADPEAAKEMEQAILAAKDDEDSVGGIVQLEINGLPVGLGDPVFQKLDVRLTAALMTLGAVKGIEVGRGFELAGMRGSESNDNMGDEGFLSNNAGGITGGISTGQPVIIRLVVKPTSSIAKPQKTVDTQNQERTIEVHGRHDPCIVPRVIPVVENMAALVILDAWEVQAKLRPDWQSAAK
jgi:chorismate synthase